MDQSPKHLSKSVPLGMNTEETERMDESESPTRSRYNLRSRSVTPGRDMSQEGSPRKLSLPQKKDDADAEVVDETPEAKRKRDEIILEWKKNRKSRKQWWSTIAITAAVIAVVLRFYQLQRVEKVQEPALGTPEMNATAKDRLVRKALADLRKAYANQSLDTWVNLHSAILSSVSSNPDPTQPSSIVMIVPPDVKFSFAKCIAHELGEKVHEIFNTVGVLETKLPPNVMTVTLLNFTSGSTVSDNHAKLEDYLKHSGKAVVVEDIHLMKIAEHVLTFHAFCDNTEAPDKRAVFIFLLPVHMKPHSTDKHSIDKLATQTLNEVWTDVLGADKAPALVARVAAYNVLLNPGDKCSTTK